MDTKVKIYVEDELIKTENFAYYKSNAYIILLVLEEDL